MQKYVKEFHLQEIVFFFVDKSCFKPCLIFFKYYYSAFRVIKKIIPTQY